MKLFFDHHTITNKPHNIQIRLENRTKHVGHYTALRRKITKVGGNLPLVVHFRVLCSLCPLTVSHSFLFLFLLPLFLFFLLLFSSFLFFSFPPFLFSFPSFLFSFPPFLFSLPPPSPCCSHELNCPGIEFDTHIYSLQCVPCMLTHGMPCVTHMACHVPHMHAFSMHCETWLAICHSHGLPCVTAWFSMCHPHCSPSVARHPLPRNT